MNRRRKQEDKESLIFAYNSLSLLFGGRITLQSRSTDVYELLD
ncbi:MAG: hypothetical protein RMY34_15920 [Aulosira sp. DedQUE10]|nr:hypothetical protein [Aulosira sp. DedQUE10]